MKLRRIALFFGASALAACAAQKASQPSEPVVLPPQPDPQGAEPAPAEPPITTLSDDEARLVETLDAGSEELPYAWTHGPAAKPEPFATAMKNAQASRRNFEAVLGSLRGDGGQPSASAFGRGA